MGMNKYYKQLIQKNKLINFGCFSGNAVKDVVSFNYQFIFCFYKQNIFFNFDKFLSVIKKIFPIFNSVVDNKGKFLFIGSKHMYSQIVLKNKIVFFNEALEMNVGTFTNFQLTGFKSIKNFKILKKPSIILFFQDLKSDFLILEAKKNNIPIIATVLDTYNIGNLDYPILLNCSYFYNIYILSRFFFKYILKLI